MLIQTNPSIAGYQDHEAPTPVPVGYVNRRPDNNDDLDCLPERAQLANGPDRGPPNGSGSDLVDSPLLNADTLFGPQVRGELPSNPAAADRCDEGDLFHYLIERDAIRFAAAILKDDPTQGSEGACTD